MRKRPRVVLTWNEVTCEAAIYDAEAALRGLALLAGVLITLALAFPGPWVIAAAAAGFLMACRALWWTRLLRKARRYRRELFR
ncbi:hypothetical protein [Amycolatopsis sp. Poz14]|uniref:hypothetical protein n=1 Tax=Amycolatopsis sp. Poz14 TaxID=1447705 RepID=UPI001EE998E2|nr:hypothetical protein [Amycolatopsis sp. Poz14]MCG3748891.1 hypothetical protein [Amycolatopsis sp. Poz14]